MANHILVPTDFSDGAENAYRYAQHLARQQNARLTLIHVYHPSFDLDNPYLDTPEVDFGNLKQEALETFARSHRLSSEGNVEVVSMPELKLVIGFAGEEIVRMSPEASLIVMGTTGTGNLMDRLFGSVSSHAAQHAHCPVLLVPAGTAFEPPFRIMYASNFQPTDETTLQRAVQKTGIEPEVVHFVHAEPKAGVDCRVAELSYKQLARSEGPELNLKFVKLDCEHILGGLLTYGKEHEINLIIMGTVHRNFLERLFHRSVTRSMVFQTSIPLLVMHYDDED